MGSPRSVSERAKRGHCYHIPCCYPSPPSAVVTVLSMLHLSATCEGGEIFSKRGIKTVPVTIHLVHSWLLVASNIWIHFRGVFSPTAYFQHCSSLSFRLSRVEEQSWTKVTQVTGHYILSRSRAIFWATLWNVFQAKTRDVIQMGGNFAV